jgi:hypothetical protein
MKDSGSLWSLKNNTAPTPDRTDNRATTGPKSQCHTDSTLLRAKSGEGCVLVWCVPAPAGGERRLPLRQEARERPQVGGRGRGPARLGARTWWHVSLYHLEA